MAEAWVNGVQSQKVMTSEYTSRGQWLKLTISSQAYATQAPPHISSLIDQTSSPTSKNFTGEATTRLSISELYMRFTWSRSDFNAEPIP